MQSIQYMYNDATGHAMNRSIGPDVTVFQWSRVVLTHTITMGLFNIKALLASMHLHPHNVVQPVQLSREIL